MNACAPIWDTVGIPFVVNRQLVRGLDYYTSTVFEWVTDKLGAQSAVCAGGRYDGLVEQLGGRPTPAAGFALGVERLLELIQLEGRHFAASSPDVYIASMGGAAELKGAELAEGFRNAEMRVIANLGGGNFKKQLKRADNSGARFAVILGEDELSRQSATVKDLRTDTEQVSVSFSELNQYLKNSLAPLTGRPAMSV